MFKSGLQSKAAYIHFLTLFRAAKTRVNTV